MEININVAVENMKNDEQVKLVREFFNEQISELEKFGMRGDAVTLAFMTACIERLTKEVGPLAASDWLCSMGLYIKESGGLDVKGRA